MAAGRPKPLPESKKNSISGKGRRGSGILPETEKTVYGCLDLEHTGIRAFIKDKQHP